MVPDDAKSGALVVSARTATGGADASTDVEVRRERRILLTTDKPLYQPGQTIHVRALAVKRPQNSPVAGEEAIFEVQDPKGNKVFR
ncbi:MAG: hypothetical protein IV100_30455, partial [Myxococcales bacterium]|nr:hypothetical protein [Myxococcales bacterium]